MEPTQRVQTARQIASWDAALDAWIPNQDQTMIPISGHLDVFSGTFPTSGMTVNGVAYEQPTWAPHMADTGSLSLPLLKTPTSQLAVNGGSQHPDRRKAGGHGPTLADEVEHLLPTPTVGNATGGNASRSGSRSKELLLPGVVMTLLPTPAACVANDGESTKTWLARRERVKLTAANGNGMGMPLTIAALLIEESTGVSTGQPSDAGNKLWEEVPLPLPNPQDATADTD